MAHPYRALAPATDTASRDPEALAVYALLAVLGLTRLIVAVALREPIGAENTLALAMLIAATLGALTQRRL